MAGTGSGRLKKYPWPNSQSRRRSLSACSGSSIPSATARKPGRMDQLQDGGDEGFLLPVRRQPVERDLSIFAWRRGASRR